MMTHNTSTCTWCNGEMDAALAHDAVVRVVGRPEKANFAPAGSSGQATADFPKPTEIAHFAKRKRPASRKYVVAEDNGVTKAVQQAVDDGCINAGPDDNQWDWRKPIVLASWGTREHSPATPQVLPNIETAVPGGGGGLRTTWHRSFKTLDGTRRLQKRCSSMGDGIQAYTSLK
jgi:hypothetical protein